MKRFDTTLLSLEPVARDYFEFRFAWDPEAGTPVPGAFLTVRAGGEYDPVLRRPFAFSGYDREAGAASFIFQRRGRGTAYLAELATGAVVDVLGPLGTGFSMPGRDTRPVLVAGGIGLGPILYLATAMRALASEGRCEAPLTVLGFRSADYVPSLALPESTVICTDDGSAGFHGSAGDYLASMHESLPPSFYACGPGPMMAAVGRAASLRNAPYQAATEQWMACGVGACMGCAVRMADGSYARACADGPVFDGKSVDWGNA
jgi:dihydroorotate dehydrogenase electron transfer subunit